MGPLRSLYDGNVMTSMTSLLATLRCHGLDKLFHPAKSLYQYLLYVDETIFLLGKLGTNNRTPIYPDQFTSPNHFPSLCNQNQDQTMNKMMQTITQINTKSFTWKT